MLNVRLRGCGVRRVAISAIVLATSVLFTLQASGQTGTHDAFRAFALVIGEGKYENVPALPNARNDGDMFGLYADTLEDLREHDCQLLTMGQYLRPSKYHLPVAEYVHPDRFAHWGEVARSLGFESVASGPLVRSSYHADGQAELVKAIVAARMLLTAK